MAGAREHSPEDFITKTTTVSPSDRGKQIWLDCLDTIFCGDWELIDYVQTVSYTHLGFYIGKPSAGRKRDKEHPVLARELDAVGLVGVLESNSFHNGTVDRPPKLHNFRICLPPCVHKGRQFVFGQPLSLIHICTWDERVYRFSRAYAREKR